MLCKLAHVCGGEVDLWKVFEELGFGQPKDSVIRKHRLEC
jgi:hypothetical protein